MRVSRLQGAVGTDSGNSCSLLTCATVPPCAHCSCRGHLAPASCACDRGCSGVPDEAVAPDSLRMQD